MNLAQVESDLQTLSDQPFEREAFLWDLLEAFHVPKATITKLKQAHGASLSADGEVVWKNRLFFRIVTGTSLTDEVERLRHDPIVTRKKIRMIVVTDGESLASFDVKAVTFIDTPLSRIADEALFLLPLGGIEQYEAPNESAADVRATTRVARLYDAILEANSDWIERNYAHDLNLFMTRILFCYFAEDTSIIERNLFTSSIINYSNDDGSDTHSILTSVFEAMNTKPEDRATTGLPEYAKKFPYVNGGLFRDQTAIPKFSKKARRLLRECGELVWKEINPDIFGSMVQAVCDPSLREKMGLHYTSVPNIMKVLQPLFLNSFEDELLSAIGNQPKLKKLLQRIQSVRIFDPACGSGNFLIIAYRELRQLEMRVFKHLDEVSKQKELPYSGVKLSQFYGIELTDFAAETAKLSLWIAEYQMNEVFKATFGSSAPNLPLEGGGNITRGNAADENWETACPTDLSCETFIVGNPPFEGARGQTPDQKADIKRVLGPHYPGANSLDYVAIWFHLASAYLRRSPGAGGFVATSSLCEGQSVPLFWKPLIASGVEIGFAHTSFKWKNNAQNNAAVSCVIVGIRAATSLPKVLYTDSVAKAVSNISPYLTDSPNIIVEKRTSSPSGIPPLVMGNQAIEGGHLILSKQERDEIVADFPQAAGYIRPLYGANDFVEGISRFCIWVHASELHDAELIEPFRKRFERVKAFRETGGEVARGLVNIPYRFRYVHEAQDFLLVVPRTTTAKRSYISCGILGKEAIVTDAVQVIYDPEMYLFSILSSRMHMAWLKAVGGKFKADPRYSNTLVYNTFPLPSLSEDQKMVLEELAYQIMAMREAYPGRSLGWLYDPLTMPPDLLQAHEQVDEVLETFYTGHVFRSDAERLAHLFKMYAATSAKHQKAHPKLKLGVHA